MGEYISSWQSSSKKTFSPFITLLSCWEKSEPLCTQSKVSAVPPCSKQYFPFHFIGESKYPFAFKAWIFILNVIQVLNLGAYFHAVKILLLPFWSNTLLQSLVLHLLILQWLYFLWQKHLDECVCVSVSVRGTLLPLYNNHWLPPTVFSLKGSFIQ